MNKEYEIDIKEVDKTEAKEHVVAVAKGLITQIPVVGEIINEYLLDYKFNRLKNIVRQLIDKVKEIEDSLDEDYLKTEEFSYYFEISLKKAMEEFEEEKRRYLIGFLIGTMENTQTNNAEKDFYLNLIDKLTPLQLKIIRLLNNPEKYFEDNGLDITQIKKELSEPKCAFGFSYDSDDSLSLYEKFIKHAFGDVNIEIVKISYEELFDLGLTTTKEEIFGNGTSLISGSATIKSRLNEIGNKFINFCEAY